MLKFSIIVPVYNVQSYIEKCLNSLKKQTYTNFEVIIVDDGSTDNSGNLCKDFCDSDIRFKYLYQINSGQGPARNLGIDFSTGDYLLFLDSDDWVEASLLERCAMVLNESNIDFLNFRFNFITEEGVIKKTAGAYRRQDQHNPYIFCSALVEDQIYSVVWNKAYKRSLIINWGIRFPDIRAIEDIYFTRAVSKFSTSVKYINDILYHALVRPNSSSRSMGIHSFKDAEKLLQLEYNSLILDLENSDYVDCFHAHAVKFLTYLLVQAAYRIESYDEYIECALIVYNNPFYKKSYLLEVNKFLHTKNIAMIYISRSPFFLRMAAKVSSLVGVTPY